MKLEHADVQWQAVHSWKWNKLAMEMEICALWLDPERTAAPAEKPLKGESV